MKAPYPITLSLLIALLVSGCGGGPTKFQVTRGSETIGTSRTGTVVATRGARIVHFDELARIATIRSGKQFEGGDFITTAKNGVQTALLKVEPVRPEGLRTAYVLEGKPSINDFAEQVSKSEAERLSQLYPDQAEF